MHKISNILQFCLAAVPLLSTPGLIFLLAEGWLNFGGGGKDILFAFVYALWALVFLAVAIVLIKRGWTVRRWARRAGLVSIATVGVLWLAAFVASLLNAV